MQVVAPPSVAGQTERCRRWRHSFPSSGAAAGHTGARKQSADRVYISSQPCRVLCPPPAPVETSPAAAAGASLETRRLLSEERAAQAPEEESGPERGPGIAGPPVPTSGARCAPFLPRDPRTCSCRNLQFLMHAVPLWCALPELRSWFAVDACRPAQRTWPLATCRGARAVCDLDNAGKEDLVRTVTQLAAQELDHLAPATDHS